MEVISIKNGVINYPNSNKKLLEVDINIRENEICVFVGKNGSGKTTFFDVLVGFRKLYSKSLFKVYSDSIIGYCIQDFNSGLFPWLNVMDNILLPNKLKGSDDINELAEYYLNKFNLFSKRYDYPYQLSGGQKQVINIIRTLCTPSKLLLFDEPFSALHPNNTKTAISLIKDMKKTILIITHTTKDIVDMEPDRSFILDKEVKEKKLDTLINFFEYE